MGGGASSEKVATLEGMVVPLAVKVFPPKRGNGRVAGVLGMEPRMGVTLLYSSTESQQVYESGRRDLRPLSAPRWQLPIFGGHLLTPGHDRIAVEWCKGRQGVGVQTSVQFNHWRA
jgi:hypothetical protein